MQVLLCLLLSYFQTTWKKTYVRFSLLLSLTVIKCACHNVDVCFAFMFYFNNLKNDVAISFEYEHTHCICSKPFTCGLQTLISSTVEYNILYSSHWF